jgi:predicted nucleic acid-binding protein
MAALVNHRPGAVALASSWIADHEAATSVLVYAEAFEYIRLSQRFVRNYQALRDLLVGITPFDLTVPILERYAHIRVALRRHFL